MKKNLIFPWLIVFYEMAIYLSMDAYMPALPRIAQQFHTTVGVAQFTASIWMVGGLLLQLVFGPLSDRYGRRPILLLGGILYFVASLLCAIATNIDTLMFARFLQGMAMPSMLIAGYAAVNEYFNSEHAVKMLARMNSVTILAPAFGPLLGGAFLLMFSWRWIFVILALWGLLAIILLYFKMPETLPVEKRLTTLKINTIAHEYKKAAYNLKFIMFSLVTFLPIIGLIAWMLAGPFIVIQKFHYTTLGFGLIQTFIFASFILGNKLVSKYASNKRNDRLINIGFVFTLGGAILISVFSWIITGSLLLPVFFIMLMTFGSGLSVPILSRLTLEQSDARMGIRVTIFSSARIGSGVMGAICLSLFYNGTMLSMALIMLVFIALAVILRLRYR